MTALMGSFPPPIEEQVTLENWRQPPFNRWGFQHVREIIPSADIATEPDDLWHLPSFVSDALDDFFIEDETVGLIRFDKFFELTHSDAFILVHQGRVLLERYANGMRRGTPHILMSVSKSMLSLLVGILVSRGQLDVEADATSYVPELKGSAFDGTTVRHLLDMRSGLDFEEDYLAEAGSIIQYRKATNWNPLEPGETPSDLRAFLPTLTDRSGSHGGSFNYVSPCSDLLGWIIERASSHRYPDLFSELIWRPMGAAQNAYITVDRLGAPRCAGGMCMTAMDLARVGQLIVEGGRRGNKQILPEEWLEDIVLAGDPRAWDAGSFAIYWSGRDMHYRSKWYVERGDKPLLSGYGIHGQHLFVDPKNAIVIAKLSSGPLPVDSRQISLTMKAVDSIRARLMV